MIGATHLKTCDRSWQVFEIPLGMAFETAFAPVFVGSRTTFRFVLVPLRRTR